MLSGTIHGILRVPLCLEVNEPDSHWLVVYGGREFAQLLFLNNEWRRSESGRPTSLSDWISTAYLFEGGVAQAAGISVPHSKQVDVTNRLVVLTCHGVAMSLELRMPTTALANVGEQRMRTTARTVRTAKCPDKETLYCARIAVDRRLVGLVSGETHHWRGLTFLGGTAFGQLIVWDCGGEEGQSRIVQRTSCHNVSVALWAFLRRFY